uniref:Tetratricopeptide repeat protein n=1 Tax=Planktothricoides sp. SpSt-374 TaxID=2282167 RepID=A0A7C3ZNV0_9CYAN
MAILGRIEVLEAQSHHEAAELGNAYLSLGNLYRDVISSGGSSGECLEVAIAAYERVLQLLDREPPSPQMEANVNLWADLGNDVGNFYWMLSRFRANDVDKISCLDLSAKTYEKALDKVKLNNRFSAQGTIENNLGTVFGELARYREPVANLERSIAAYKEALLIRQAELETAILSPSGTPEMHHSAAKAYAATQNNLGTAYWNLAQHGEPVAHLQAAIAAYKEALEFYQPKEQPLDYGMIHNNLGTAYWNLSQYEETKENLLLAIGAYQVALMYRTAKVAPSQSAATHNNLGTAYSHLAKISQDEPALRLQFFAEAVAAYTNAIDIAATIHQSATNGKTLPPLAFDIFAAHNNLGLAHYHLATETPEDSLDKPSRQSHLEAALHHHVQAYTGWSEQKSEFSKTAFGYLLQTIRGFYSQLGIQGQSRALSGVPGHLLPEIMSRL